MEPVCVRHRIRTPLELALALIQITRVQIRETSPHAQAALLVADRQRARTCVEKPSSGVQRVASDCPPRGKGQLRLGR